MKPGSIIVLIIAVILVIAGIITCLAGASMAKSNGRDQELFTQYRDGMTYSRRDFKSSDVKRIEIRVSDAKINITGGAPTSYVEVINYDPSKDTVTTNQSSVIIEETTGSSAMNFWENGFSFFKGFRNLFSSLSKKNDGGAKTVNVYLGDKTSVSLIDIESEDCEIKVDGINVKDIRVKSGKCVLTVNDSSSDATISVESQIAKIELDSVSADRLDVSSEESLDLVAVGCSFKNTSVAAKDGKIDVQNDPGGEKTAFDITSKSGTVTVDGEKVEEGYRKNPEDPDSSVKITADTAQITYTKFKKEAEPAPDDAATDNNG